MKIPILSKWIESQVMKGMKEQYVELRRFFVEARDIILSNDVLFDAMAKQRVLLLKQKRKPIAIFISIKILEDVIVPKIKFPFETQFWKIHDGGVPVTYIAKIPVYVSSLLKDAPLLVVGSITWKSEVNNGNTSRK